MRFWLPLKFILLFSISFSIDINASTHTGKTDTRVLSFFGLQTSMKRAPLWVDPPSPLGMLLKREFLPVYSQHILKYFIRNNIYSKIISTSLKEANLTPTPFHSNQTVPTNSQHWNQILDEINTKLNTRLAEKTKAELDFEKSLLKKLLTDILIHHPDAARWLKEWIPNQEIFDGILSPSPTEAQSETLAHDIFITLKLYLEQTSYASSESELGLAKNLLKQFLLVLNPERELWQMEHLPLPKIKMLGHKILQEVPQSIFEEAIQVDQLRKLSPFPNSNPQQSDIEFQVGELSHTLRVYLFQGSCYTLNQETWEISTQDSFKPLNQTPSLNMSGACVNTLLKVLLATETLFKNWMAHLFLNSENQTQPQALLIQKLWQGRLINAMPLGTDPIAQTLLTEIVERLTLAILEKSPPLEDTLLTAFDTLLITWSNFKGTRKLSINTLLEQALLIEASRTIPTVNINLETDPSLEVCVDFSFTPQINRTQIKNNIRTFLGKSASCNTLDEVNTASYFKCMSAQIPNTFEWLLKVVVDEATPIEIKETYVFCSLLSLDLEIELQNSAKILKTEANHSSTVQIETHRHVQLEDVNFKVFTKDPSEVDFTLHPELTHALHVTTFFKFLLTHLKLQIQFEKFQVPLNLPRGYYRFQNKLNSKELVITTPIEVFEIPPASKIWTPVKKEEPSQPDLTIFSQKTQSPIKNLISVLKKPTLSWTFDDRANVYHYNFHIENTTEWEAFLSPYSLKDLTQLKNNLFQVQPSFEPRVITMIDTEIDNKKRKGLNQNISDALEQLNFTQSKLDQFQVGIDLFEKILADETIESFQTHLKIKSNTVAAFTDWLKQHPLSEKIILEICTYTLCQVPPERILTVALIHQELIHPETTPHFDQKNTTSLSLHEFWNTLDTQIDSLEIQLQKQKSMLANLQKEVAAVPL
jgi:hypothetical protein